jgi:hypothetical protein
VIGNATLAMKYARQAAGLDPFEMDGNMQFFDVVDRSKRALSWALQHLGFDINNANDIALRAQLDGAIVNTADLIMRSLTVGAAVHKAA